MENGNQPAFPIVNGVTGVITEEGLTKREYFAAMAMHGILAGGDITKKNGTYIVNGRNLNLSLIAKDAIDCADALLTHLSNPTK